MTTTATKPETKKARKAREQQQARDELRALLPKGTTVYCRLDHSSRSGMVRYITPIVIKDNEPRYLSHLVSKALDWPRDGRNRFEGVKVDGAGMDMGFHLVYTLSAVLYGIDSGPNHDDGGYALKHRWL
jgi:hypothetical protein